jgi:hypothetical protein
LAARALKGRRENNYKPQKAGYIRIRKQNNVFFQESQIWAEIIFEADLYKY